MGNEIANDHAEDQVTDTDDHAAEDPDQVNNVVNNTSHLSVISRSFASSSNVNNSNNFLRKTDPMPQHWVEDLRSVFTSVLDERSGGIQPSRSIITKRKTYDSVEDDEPIFSGSISKQRKMSSKDQAAHTQSHAVSDKSCVNDFWREYSGNDRNEPLLGPLVINQYLAGSIFIGYIVWLTVVETNLLRRQMRHCKWSVILSQLFPYHCLFLQSCGNSTVMWLITYNH